jgi:TorA maturation chaperone TorD
VNIASPVRADEEIESARAREYALLSILLSQSPSAPVLSNLACLHADLSPLGQAHAKLAEAALKSSSRSTADEYITLFAGLKEDALLPYASHYVADTLYGRPLARLRETLRVLGIEKAPEQLEPEDHMGFLCEIMAGLISGHIPAPTGADQAFFDKHLASWMRRFFVDLENRRSAILYRTVGLLGRTFAEIEAEGFGLQPGHLSSPSESMMRG